ncbi:hypothetical protein [Taibaiella koreensis]|uniref:hypothetical protein n=1 Tax=Taibaiella koreensis TaxID=1268548 RepID=UPI0013C2C152|nr:hypothetical protein [Taibaiella koreensis]
MTLTNGGAHSVLVIGYNTGSGDVIYMDPMLGATNRGSAASFLKGYEIPLKRNVKS